MLNYDSCCSLSYCPKGHCPNGHAEVAASLHQVTICQHINAAPATHESIQNMIGMRCVRSTDGRKHEIKCRREKQPGAVSGPINCRLGSVVSGCPCWQRCRDPASRRLCQRRKAI